MAHYAYVDSSNYVVDVIVGRDEWETVGGVTNWEEYYSSKRPGLRALRTSFNTKNGVHYDPLTGLPSDDQSKAFRGNYASIGGQYLESADYFIPPKPYPSWVLNEISWVAPVPYPNDGIAYEWDEATFSWATVDPISEQE